MTPSPWWERAVGYEVYLRSFSDSDGDGIGDLPGVLERLDHLDELGVELIWLTPFYPSPQADHGYDVADYRGVDPTFGSLEDVDRLVDELHARGMRLIVDLVPNHTSDRHAWFRSALNGPDDPYRDYYVWADPGPDGGPPNNWVSHFGGPAWTLDEASGQYYLHLFLPEQPDLNWANPAVRSEFDDILRFWFERGVDGLRIDVAHSLVIDPRLRDNPAPGDRPTDPRELFAAFEHRHDLDQPGVVDIYRRWRKIADEHDALLLGEVYLVDPGRVARYVDDGALQLAFCFSVLKAGWDAAEIRQTLARAVTAVGDRAAWPLSSHDEARAASRFGGGPAGTRRALAYLTLLCALPGVPFLLQGDELGLADGRIDRDEATDPIAVRNRGATGRDGSRTPVPWAPGPALGFTDGTPWLPVGRNRTPADTVAVQRDTADSPLSRVSRLLAVRRDLAPWTIDEPPEWIGGGRLVAFRRGRLTAACNVGSEPAALSVPAGARVVYASAGEATVADGLVRVPGEATVLVVDDAAGRS